MFRNMQGRKPDSEINQLLAKIQQTMQSVAVEVKEEVSEMRRACDIVNEFEQNLETMENAAQRKAVMQYLIRRFVGRITASGVRLSILIQEIDRLRFEITEETKNVELSVKQRRLIVTEITTVSRTLSEMAYELKSSLSEFKI